MFGSGEPEFGESRTRMVAKPRFRTLRDDRMRLSQTIAPRDSSGPRFVTDTIDSITVTADATCLAAKVATATRR
jgi:hypothetical protein